MQNTNEIVLYQPDEPKKLEVRDSDNQEESKTEEKIANREIPLSEKEANDLIQRMEELSEPNPQITLTPETWVCSFGLNNSLQTPIGKVKMGEGQYRKFFDKNRSLEFGMAVLTLKDPNVIFIEASHAKKSEETERPYSYVFIKTFEESGKKFKYYSSVTVRIDNMEVSVSSHCMKPTKVLRRLVTKDRVYTKSALLSNSSDRHLAEQQNVVPDLLPTQENNASSIGKDTVFGVK